MSPEDLIFMAEKLPSIVNCLLVSMGTGWVLFKEQAFKDSVITPYPKVLDRALAAHIGYTLYDTILMAIVGKQHISAWIHHVFGLIGTGLMREYRVASYFPTIFMLSELTVVATNVLWMMTKLGKDKSQAFGVWLLIRWVAFLILRAPVGVVGLWYALKVTKRSYLKEKTAELEKVSADDQREADRQKILQAAALSSSSAPLSPARNNAESFLATPGQSPDRASAPAPVPLSVIQPITLPNPNLAPRSPPNSPMRSSTSVSRKPIKPLSTSAAALLLFSRLRQLPTPVWVLTCINYITFTGLNSYWTILVFKALIRFQNRADVHHI
ncbi:hypothetical protein DFS34DRAFT_584307 [Phlyctochytrium arcticum]|nr:hypothetical protein DFS34DRAFT_584307 [Phlyctochytrium arcticum]